MSTPDPLYESLPSTSLDPRTDPSQAEPAGEAAGYVEQTLDCAPEELEALARREAVDGWELVDTTVDPARPERLLAHFRKAAPVQRQKQRREARPRAEPRATRARPAPAKPAPATPTTAQPERRARREKLSSKRPSDERVYWAALLLSGAVLLEGIGWPGLFVTLFVVPSAARMISRLPKRELAILGIATAFVVANLGWPGLFLGLWVLPGIIRSIFEKQKS